MTNSVITYDLQKVDYPIPTKAMLETIAVILLILWLIGVVSGTTIGGLVHVLLVIAIVVVLIRIIRGRRPVV